MKLADRSYCFVSSSAPSVIEGAKRLSIPALTDGADDARVCLFAAPPGGADIQHLFVVNNRNDHACRDIIDHAARDGDAPPPYDSLVSAAFVAGRHFRCVNDYWGLRTHYWYEDGGTFVCSDNVFNVAALTDRDIAEESFFEYLLFLAPIRDHTWFAGIRCLLPGQSLAYDRRTHAVRISKPLDLVEDLIGCTGGTDDVASEVRAFFGDARAAVGAATAAVSLSAGSDSRTVLAGLNANDYPLRAYSFGSPALYETRETDRLTKRLGIDWRLVDVSDAGERWHELFRKSTVDSNGLLNPLRTHYELLYEAIPPDEVVFEGILGSQFLKGEHCIGATISAAHRDILTGKASPEEVLETRFSRLGEPLHSRMREYIIDLYGGELIDVNTDGGLRAFQSFAFSVFPSRIFAGIVLIAGMRHDLYYPFLSPRVLRAVFERGLGVARNVSLRSDAHGYIRSVLPESVIVRELDEKLYASVLDRGFSFKEMCEYPLCLVRLLMSVRELIKRVRYRNCLFGQIDNSRIEGLVARYARNQAGTHRLVDALLEDGTRFKEAAQIGMIRSLRSEMRP